MLRRISDALFRAFLIEPPMRWALPIVANDQTLHHVELITIGINWSIWACSECGLIVRIGTEAHDFSWDGKRFILGTNGPVIWGKPWQREVTIEGGWDAHRTA